MVWGGSPKCGVAGSYRVKPGAGLGEAGTLVGPDPQAQHPAVLIRAGQRNHGNRFAF